MAPGLTGLPSNANELDTQSRRSNAPGIEPDGLGDFLAFSASWLAQAFIAPACKPPFKFPLQQGRVEIIKRRATPVTEPPSPKQDTTATGTKNTLNDADGLRENRNDAAPAG